MNHWSRNPVVIGHPTLVEKTLDESVYPSIARKPVNNTNAALNKDLPALPRLHSASRNDKEQRQSSLKRVSLGRRSHLSRGGRSPDRISDISPPSTPVSSGCVHEHPYDVSPTDEQPPQLFDDTDMAPHSNDVLTLKSSNIPSGHSFHKSPSLGNLKRSANAQTANRYDNVGLTAAKSTTWQGRVPKAGGFFKNLTAKRKTIGSNGESPADHDPWAWPSERPTVEQTIGRKFSLRKSKSHDRLRMEHDVPCPPFVPSVVTTITAGKEKKYAPLPKKRTAHKEAHKPARPALANPLPPRIDLPRLGHLNAEPVDLETGDRPVSRFSATTDGYSEADSLINSASVSTTEIDTTSTENLSPAMVREQLIPKAKTLASTKIPPRKPVPMEANKALSISSRNSRENQTEKRIKDLEARREGLASRKANVVAVIHELTEVVQPSSVAYDLAVRDEVKKTVATLNDELAEIQKEEHDIGLQLIRAWRRRDERDLNGGESSLWVRRVTN
ncbi:hypothetical protein MPDQ_003195 [Monascus purpureus]|uniref:Uncharacterized protein n=1 Tax=Monascus purpureus TaxID=5098 RepID=A0A507QLB7_MONPU|nr:hypothetical protein MPDQ_003195 [Monascus purpureus]